MKYSLQEKEKIEIDFWKNSATENPDHFTKENMLSKLIECKHFDYKVKKFIHHIAGKKDILEIGAGQGWASCYLKKYFLPQSHFTVSDISPYALDSVKYWEKLFDVQIDKRAQGKSYDLGFEDKSYDLIFSFAAVHHFVKQKETLEELKRLLKPDGIILYFYEPTSPRFWHPLVYWLVNKRHHSTPEDVLIPYDIKKAARSVGLECDIEYDAFQSNIRSIISGAYFKLLKLMPWSNNFLPSSASFVFSH